MPVRLAGRASARQESFYTCIGRPGLSTTELVKEEEKGNEIGFEDTLVADLDWPDVGKVLGATAVVAAALGRDEETPAGVETPKILEEGVGEFMLEDLPAEAISAGFVEGQEVADSETIQMDAIPATEPGQEWSAGTPLEELPGEAIPEAAPTAAPAAAAQPAAQPAPSAFPTPAAPAPVAPAAGGRVKASPLAKRMASDRGLDLAGIAGSGPEGRIVKRDIESARSGPSGAAPARAVVVPTGAAYVDTPLNQIRKTIIFYQHATTIG